jgi:hypothetical protein
MTKSILRASAGLQALALLGAGTAASFIVASPASAQDYTSGAILATITNNNGAPVAGAAVTLRSLAQGQVRTFVTNSNGSFTASGLAPGEYSINVAASGYQPYDDTLTVTAAQSSSVTVGLVSVTQTSAITVVGRRLRQTATGGTTGLNIDVAAVNANAPLAHDITAITLLAPTVQRGVRGFAQANGEDVPSVGGSSVAENAYYVNGLNITNPDTYVGSARVPFYFYKNVDVQTGGYAAEFGRATGGVINATTKAGSNVPFLALHLDWEPGSLQSHHPNIGTEDTPTDIGRMDRHDSKVLTLEGGGAIIPDHLFVYGLISPQRDTLEYANGTGGTTADASIFTREQTNDPFWGGKIDAYINPTQHAEFTIFDTRSNDLVTNYKFTPNAGMDGGTVGQKLGSETIKTGGLNWVARYTGDITDWLTLSGAYGISKDAADFIPADRSAYFVSDLRFGTPNTISGQTFSQTNIADTKRRFYRGDADIRFSAAGQHHIRMGFDNEDLSETKTTDCNGVLPICWQYRTDGIRLTYEHLGGHVTANDTAYYIEDSWQTPLDGLTLNLGIRDDEFRQNNLIGEQTINFKGNWGPRVAFSYTPPALDKLKLFGSYGRYFIPPAMNLSFRGKDLFYRETFDYPGGVDPEDFTDFDPVTGLPNGPLGAPNGNAGHSPCPTVDWSSAPGAPAVGGNFCTLLGAGIQNPALAKVVPGTKATYEDEFILGARYQVSRLLSVGIQGTYRKLGRVSEDTDFHPQLQAYWCGLDQEVENNATHCDFYTANSTYMIWNVSNTKSLVVNDWLDALSGKVTPVTLTTGMHFPTPTRSFKSIVLDFNRADDGLWQAAGSVTWSRLRGSTEGTVKSDAGNGAQGDAGSTQDFDYLGLSDYGYGRLPNDHTWQFKLFGALHLNQMFTIGANVFVQSPMPGSCLGYHPYYPQPDVYDPSTFYGAGSHFCSTGPVNENGYQESTAPSPRGTGWKSQWLKQLDLSARVNIPFGGSDTRKLVLRADVFNVFNSHAVTQRYAEHEDGYAFQDPDPESNLCGEALECFHPNSQYGTPLYYQTPRYVRLGLDLLWGGSPPAPPVAEVVAPPPPPPPAAPATQTCPDGTVILATDACPVPPPPPPPPPATSGERGQ